MATVLPNRDKAEIPLMVRNIRKATTSDMVSAIAVFSLNWIFLTGMFLLEERVNE